MIGETLGSFRVLKQIGTGGMGVVYFAQHQLIGRRAAVKVLMPEFSRDATMVHRFFNEARSTALIQHPGLVDIFDFGFHPSGAAYLIMEYLEGETLGARRERERRLPVWMVDAIMRQVASAVGAAHASGVIHRDLKPDNIFLIPDRNAPAHMRAKVLDFGVAKLNSAAGGPSPHTRTGSMLGTPLYMSPEQCRGAGHVDHRTDIYSIGCIIFELLLGRPVFVTQGLGELLAAHQRLTPPSPSSIDRTIPRELDALILRMLAKRPEERVQSLDEVEETFARLAATCGWEAYWSRRTGSVVSPIVMGGPPLIVGSGGDPGMSMPPPQPMMAMGTPQPRAWGSMPPSAPAASVPPRPPPQTPAGSSAEMRPTQPEHVVAKRRRRRSLAISLGTFLILFGGGTAFLVSRQRSAPAPVSVAAPAPSLPAPPPPSPPAAKVEPPPPSVTPIPVAAEVRAPVPAPPVHVSFEVRSEPTGAEVLRDGKPVGKTPFTVDETASDGTVTFVLRAAGYEDARAEFPAGHGGRADLVLTKLPAPPAAAPPPKEVAAPPPPPAPPKVKPAAPRKPKPPLVDL